MILFPEGSLRRTVAEWLDRQLGGLLFGEDKTLSTHCGDRLKAGAAGVGCKCMCKVLNVIEQDHCLKNAGKP